MQRDSIYSAFPAPSWYVEALHNGLSSYTHSHIKGRLLSAAHCQTLREQFKVQRPQVTWTVGARTWTDNPSCHSKTRVFTWKSLPSNCPLPLPPFKKRVVAQATVSRCWFVELWPAALHQRLRLHPAILLLVTGLHQDNPDSVELLDESQGFLDLRLTLGYLQRAVQQLHCVLPLDVPLSRTQGLVRIK